MSSPGPKDPATPFKHIRITDMDPTLLEELKTFPGIKAIVKHSWGSKKKDQSSPHYHIWWEGYAVTTKTLKVHLKAHSAYISSHSGTNGFWRIAAHKSYDNWAKYVMNNHTAEVLMEDPARPLPPRVELPVLPPAASGGTGAASATVILKEPSKRLAQRVRFVKHLENHGWQNDDVKVGIFTRSLIDM